MAEQAKVPAIRFAGFTDPWEQRELGELVDNIDTGRSVFCSESYGRYPVLGSTSVIGSDSSYDYEGAFLLTARVGANAGNLYRFAGKVKISDNTVFLQAPNSDFLFYLLGHFDLRKLSFGTGQPLVRASELRAVEIDVPKLENEQKSIAEFFDHLDSLITLHQRKYDKLVVFKKSMLEKMFPKDGESVPEIRFAGFTDPWEQRKLGDVADLLTGYPFESRHFTDTGIPLVRGMNVKRGYLDMSADICENWSDAVGVEDYLLKAGDIVIQMDGALIGSSYAMVTPENTPSLLVQRVTRVRCGNRSRYIFQAVQRGFLRYIKSLKTETAVPHLSLSDIADYAIPVPKEEREQEHIGSFFSRLDDLITLHQRKLELLQNIKKSLLDKMFV